MIDRLRNRTLTGLLCCAGLTAGLTTGFASAQDLSDALDFVPGDAAVVISTHNLKKTHGRMSFWAQTMKMTDAQEALGMAQLLLANEGLNAEGPAVVVLPEIDPDAAGPEPIIIAPVADFEAFVFGLGGEAQEGVTTINAPFGTVHAMNLGGGFAALAQDADLLDFLDADGGNSESHEMLMGATGRQISNDSDLLLAANIEALTPLIEQSVEAMSNQVNMMGAMGGMGGEQVEAITGLLSNLSDRLINDGHAGMLGFNLPENGLSLDLGANFKEDSETAGYFRNEGNAGKHLAELPSMPFMFAMAMDYSSDGIRSMLEGMAQAADGMGGGGGGMMGGASFLQLMSESTGQAQLMGTTPGLFAGGLFANTLSFTASETPEDLSDLVRGIYADMDGEVVGGMEFETSYERGATTIEGVEVDAWAMNMSVDPNDPNAMQAQMAMQQQMMLMGGTGPQGFIAVSDAGLIQTMSRNSELVSKALKTTAETSFASDARITEAASNLPGNRIAEGYLDVGEVIKLVGSAAAMFGAEVPAVDGEMAPVAMGLVGDGGGLRMRTHVPQSVITTVIKTAREMGAGMEIEEGDGGGAPRF